MKIIKTLICAMAAAAVFTLSTSSAKADVTIVGQSFGFEKVNFTAILVTNAPGKTTGNETNYTTVYKVGAATINNKSLIAFFATWSTNDTSGWTAAGAQLIWDFASDELCVADKSGENILLYTGDTENNGPIIAYLDFEPYSDEGPYAETDTLEKNGAHSISGTETHYGYLHMHFEDGNDADHIDFVAHGIDNVKYAYKYPAIGAGSWNDTSLWITTGHGEFRNNVTTITSLKVTISGKGTQVQIGGTEDQIQPSNR